MNDTKIITGILVRTDKVGRQEYGIVKPLVANAIGFIVTNIPAGIQEGDHVKVKALPDGARWLGLAWQKLDSAVDFSEDDEEAAVVVATAEQRAAFAKSRQAAERRSGMTADEESQELAEASF